MVLGCVWCSTSRASRHSKALRELKVKHGFSPMFEIKWTKVSIAKIDFYLEILGYFFANRDLHFRGVLIPDKSQLQHDQFQQTHDEWYYKMYFELLRFIISPRNKYRVYIDIKDSWGATKVDRLQQYICNSKYDFSRQVLERVQIIRSHETEILQLADLLIGAVGYTARGETGNEGKLRLIESIKQRTGYSLLRNTLVREEKFNLLRWAPWEQK